MDSLRVSFAHRDDSAAIRHDVRRLLTRWQLPSLLEDLLLVVSELVQNVVHHAGGRGELVITRRAEHVLVEVFDGSRTPPDPRPPDPRRARGRGLMIVKAVARAWGTRAHGAGKVVWAELAVSALPALV